MMYISSQILSHLTNDGMNRAKYMYFQHVLVRGEDACGGSPGEQQQQHVLFAHLGN